MTVKQLIEALQQYPQHSQVMARMASDSEMGDYVVAGISTDDPYPLIPEKSKPYLLLHW